MVHVGEKLYEERMRRGLSLEEVAKGTKIRISFLEALEEGDFKKLPSGTYVHGFVRNYARFLDLQEPEILALFKREYKDEGAIKVLPDGFAKEDDFPLPTFKIESALKILPLILSLLALYLLFQYRAAIFNPSLRIITPKENTIISSQEVLVTGNTDQNTTVFVNSEPVVVEKDGSFKKTINLFAGKSKITIKSVNNFNKTTTIERYVEVK